MEGSGDNRIEPSVAPGAPETEEDQWDWVEYNNNETGNIVPSSSSCTAKTIAIALAAGALVYFLTTSCLRSLLG